MPEIDLSVVLPSYCEEENLRLLLPRIRAALAELPCRSEVLVVDTVEPLDATELVCGAENARYVRRAPSNTFGDAIRTAIREARGERILFMDADGSHGPEVIPRLYQHSQDSDVVIASRYVEKGDTENDVVLETMSRLLNLSYSLILDLPVRDVSNSFKLYRGDLLRELRLKCQNFDVVEEILFKIRRAHPDVRIHEVPFTFKKRMFGRTKRNLFWFMITYVFTLLRLRFLS